MPFTILTDSARLARAFPFIGLIVLAGFYWNLAIHVEISSTADQLQLFQLLAY